MRYWLGVVLTLLAVLPAPAQEPPNLTRLTEQEVRDGWLMLFDGETTFGWDVDGAAKVAGGMLTFGGDRLTTATPTTTFRDYELVAEGRGAAKLLFETATSRASMGISGLEMRLHLHVSSGPQRGLSVSQQFQVGADNVQRLNATVEYGGADPVRLGVEVAAGGKLELRRVKLRPLGLKAIFNGKDLTGWKMYNRDPNRIKSEFTVTPEGWLNVRNGPGDLQTEEQWADFVLQFDCLSNGKHLNSGVFFRCRPGEYQQGYEAQIRNEFTADATQEYTVEEYDPQTNELKEKRKVRSPAVDYGTGAIYRRQPARKAMAKDGEWFTMTVVAHGRHLATWVNGVQVADWTDHRPRKDNARNGCRLEKGPISIQGHDKTTDLSFRNLRLAELTR